MQVLLEYAELCRNIAQQRECLLRAPAQRVIDIAGVNHPPQQAAMLGSALHRHEQREQTLALGGASIFLQSLA